MKKIILLCLLLFPVVSLIQAKEFSLPFTVTDGRFSDTLTIGINALGGIHFTDGLDELAPPPPVGETFDARIRVSGRDYYKKYQDTTRSDKEFLFIYAPNAGEGPITITWDKEEMAQYGTFILQDPFGGGIIRQNFNDFQGELTPADLNPVLGNSFLLIYNTELPEEELPVAATPTFNPPPGFYEAPVMVHIGSTTPGAVIHYTINGDIPDDGSPSFTDSISISETTTLRAIAIAPGHKNSSVSTALYSFDKGERIKVPEFSFPLRFSDGRFSDTLTIGINALGKMDFSDGLDVLAPPPPVGETFDARIRVSGRDYFTKYQDTTRTEKEFLFIYSAHSGEGPVTITWEHEKLAQYGSFILKDAFGGSIVQRNFDEFQGELTPIELNPVLVNRFLLVYKAHDPGFSGIEWDSSIPLTHSLSQNYPNPFNPVTQIMYSITVPSLVKLEVFDLKGQLIERLVFEHQDAGSYRVPFDASHLSSGIYLYRLQTDGFNETKKMIFIK